MYLNQADAKFTESRTDPFIKGGFLCRSFNVGEAEVPVLRGLSLSIKRNERLFLSGAQEREEHLFISAGLERPDWIGYYRW